MFTNHDKLIQIVNDREKLIKYLIDTGINSILCKGVCDTSKCPYLDECENYYNCKLSDEEELDIWLNMEAK